MPSKLKTSLKLVKKHFAFLVKDNEAVLLDFLMDQLKNIDLKELKVDIKFILYICELIENQVEPSPNPNEPKPNKLLVFKTILTKLFPQISSDEINCSVKIVEFLLENGLVEKVKQSALLKYHFLKKISLN